MGKPVAIFPGAVVTDARLKIATNRISTTLAAALTAGATTCTLTSATGVVANSLLSIYAVDSRGNITGNVEIISVDAAPVGNVLPTISRGYDSTTAAAHASGASVAGFVDAWHHNAAISEIEAIETYLGASGGSGALASIYNFAAQSPGGSLAIGSNSIALSPLPDGLAIGNYLYISGGVGTAEAAVITGVGANNVIVTCVNTHSGAWTIQSASGGFQEAWTANPNGIVRIAAGVTVYGPVNAPVGRSAVVGLGIAVPAITRASTYINGHLIKVPASAIVSIENMYIANGLTVAQTSGAAIYGGLGSGFYLFNVGGSIGYVFLELDSAGGCTAVNCGINNIGANFDGLAAVYVHNSLGAVPTNLSFIGGAYTMKSGTRGFNVLSCDGIQMIGVNVGAGNYSVVFGSAGAQYTSNITIVGCFFDGIGVGSGVYFGGAVINAKVVGCHIHAEANVASSYGIDIGISVPGGNQYNVSVVGCNIQGMGLSGVGIGASATYTNLSGNAILDNNASNTAAQGGVLVATGSSHLHLSGNLVNNPAQVAGHQKYALLFQGTCTNLIVGSDNDFSGNETGAISGLPAATVATAGVGLPRVNQVPNYIASETGANNAIAGALLDAYGVAMPLTNGLCVTVKLAHTLQAGANTFNPNGTGAVSIKSSRNAANNIGTAYAATGTITMVYDTTGPYWLDVSQ